MDTDRCSQFVKINSSPRLTDTVIVVQKKSRTELVGSARLGVLVIKRSVHPPVLLQSQPQTSTVQAGCYYY